MDTVGSSTYQNPSKITSTLNGYIDSMVNFTGDGLPNDVFKLTNSDIKSKQLQLGIPYNTTPAQINAINQSISYANSKGVQVVVTKIK